MQERFCGRCGSKLENGCLICPNCGNSTIEVQQCIWCKSIVNKGATICPYCGRNPSTNKFKDRFLLILLALGIFILFVFPRL